jgi:dihydrofolate reductase
MRQLTVDMFSTVDGYGSSDPPSAPYWGYGAPGLMEWIHGQLADDHVMLMGATTYRLMSEIVATGDDPTFPRMAELPKIVFSKTLKPPLTWANTTVVAEPVETAVPALKAEADGTPMRTIGSFSLARSLFRLGLVDRVRVMVFPTIRGDRGRGDLRRPSRPRPGPHQHERDRRPPGAARLPRRRCWQSMIATVGGRRRQAGSRLVLNYIAKYVDRFSPGVLKEVESPHDMEAAVPDRIAQELEEIIAAP